jgi:hypothetical protein
MAVFVFLLVWLLFGGLNFALGWFIETRFETGYLEGFAILILAIFGPIGTVLLAAVGLLSGVIALGELIDDKISQTIDQRNKF